MNLPLPPSAQEQRTRSRQCRQVWRQRSMQFIGIGLLVAGYGLLAVSPDTPSEWVLLRLVFGFGLLFAGFALAILPWLSRTSRGDE